MRYGDKQLRHELKYYIPYYEYATLRQRLKVLLKPDPYSVDESGYQIRSLYFDDAYDTALYDKTSGVMMRNKYRIRIYNKSDAVINLERKSKFGDYICKESVRLSRSEADDLAAGRYAWAESSGKALLEDLAREMKLHAMVPKTVVDYQREAYLFAAGDVRVTFDKDLMSSTTSLDLFDPELPVKHAYTEPMVILEVKYNDFLPDLVRQALTFGSQMRSAISKYVICREMSMRFYQP